jgi:hypothetical protein
MYKEQIHRELMFNKVTWIPSTWWQRLLRYFNMKRQCSKIMIKVFSDIFTLDLCSYGTQYFVISITCLRGLNWLIIVCLNLPLFQIREISIAQQDLDVIFVYVIENSTVSFTYKIIQKISTSTT